MKKFIFGLVIAIVVVCFTSCEVPSKNSSVIESTSLVDGVGYVTYVEFDGHQYVIWSNGGHKGSMCHSPKCPCLSEYKK